MPLEELDVDGKMARMETVNIVPNGVLYEI
jgi:hypothetical protein